jgi:hypothetical protein
MRWFNSIIYIAFVLFICPEIIFAQNYSMIPNTIQTPDSNLSVIGEWYSGHCLAVRSKGDIIYFSQGSIFNVMDASDINNCQIIGNIRLESNIEDIEIFDHFAFIRDEHNKLTILDLKNPQHPKLLSKYDLISNGMGPFTYPRQYFVNDKYIFIAYQADYQDERGLQGWVETVDYSDSTNPYKIGQSLEFSGGVLNILVSKNLLYLLTGNGTLQVLTLKNPKYPSEIKRIKTNPLFSNFDIADSLLYIIGEMGEITIFNISDPTQISEITKFSTDITYPMTIKANNSFVFILAWSGRLVILDIQDIMNPKMIINKRLGDDVQDIYIQDYKVYYADRRTGLSVFDATDLSNFHMAVNYETGEYCSKFFKNNDYAYIIHNEKGMSILDLSDPTLPKKVSSSNLNSYSEARMYFNEDFCYLIDDTLKILSLTDPTSPKPVKQIDSLGGSCMYLKDDKAFVGVGNNFYVFDISNPTEFVSLGSCTISEGDSWIENVQIKDNYAFLVGAKGAWWSFGEMTILDISDLSKPFVVGKYDSSYATSIIDIYTYNQNAFLFCYWWDQFEGWSSGSWIEVLDISDLANPYRLDIELFNVEYIDHLREVENACFNNNYLYAIRSDYYRETGEKTNRALEIYDFKDYKSLQKLASYNIHNYVYNMSVEDDLIYLVHSSGLTILKSEILTKAKDELNFPTSFALLQNYPNPFNPKTTIEYQLPQASHVDLSIYNISGQKLATIVSERQTKGNHKVEWDATEFASGVYLYKIETNKGHIQTMKLILLK